MARSARFDQYGVRQRSRLSNWLTSLAFIAGLLFAPILLVIVINSLAEASPQAVYVTFAWTLGIPLAISAASRFKRRRAEVFA